MTIKSLGLSQDNNSSFLTAPALAPDRIREALHSDSANLFTESGYDLGDKLLWADAGNVGLTGLEQTDAFNAIRSAVEALINAGNNIVSLGGDHSVSYLVIAAHSEMHNRLNILLLVVYRVMVIVVLNVVVDIDCHFLDIDVVVGLSWQGA